MPPLHKFVMATVEHQQCYGGETGQPSAEVASEETSSCIFEEKEQSYVILN